MLRERDIQYASKMPNKHKYNSKMSFLALERQLLKLQYLVVFCPFVSSVAQEISDVVNNCLNLMGKKMEMASGCKIKKFRQRQ